MEVVTKTPSSSVSTPVPAEWEIRDRMPMNQVEFDKHFGYISPDVENKLVHHSARFFGRFLRPFTDVSSFWKTLLSFLPILQWLPRYNIKDNLLHDMIGGFMVGIMHVPQGIAYAVLAGVHPVVGLYTSFFPVLAYMLFGTSRHNSIGSFAVVALITGNAVSNIVVSKSGDTNATLANVSLSMEPDIKPIDVTTVLCLAIGMTQVIIATIGLDFVTTYLSEQLVAGFTTGAAVHVFVTQLKDITGIYGTPRRAGVGNAILRAFDIVVEISRTNFTTLLVSAVTMTVLFIGKQYINPHVVAHSPVPIPFELLVVIFGTAISWLLSLETTFKVATVGYIPTGLPLPAFPRWKLLPHVALEAMPIAVVIMAVHISMAKLLSKKHNYSIDIKQEFYAVGFTSAISSFFPVFPSSCSLARTLVNSLAGTRTQIWASLNGRNCFARSGETSVSNPIVGFEWRADFFIFAVHHLCMLFAVFSSIFIFIVLQFGGAFLGPLPMCILASIIIVALLDMFLKFKQLPKLWVLSKIDLAIWVVAFAATAFVDVIIGLLVSILFALLTTLMRQQLPEWHVLGNITGTSEYRDVERYDQIRYVENVIVVRFDAPLLFTNVDHFREMVDVVCKQWGNAVCNSNMEGVGGSTVPSEEMNKENIKKGAMPNKFLIIDCSGLIYIDVMGVNCLKEVYTDMMKKGVHVMFASAKAPLRELFGAAGLYESVGKSNFYPTLHDAMFFAQQKRSLLGLRRILSNDSSYDTVELSDESTQSSDTPSERKLSWYNPVYTTATLK